MNPMTFDVIILAGGLGTRLRSVVADLPKCMAPVNGRPFLDILIERLRRQGAGRIILSTGYLSEVVEDWVRTHHPGEDILFSREETPLGTGGAILKALAFSEREDVLVCNGDTLFDVDVASLYTFHRSQGGECTIALKPMRDFERYGTVELGEDGWIRAFREKEPCQEGLINGGVYVINKASLLSESFPEKFSFEDGYLAKRRIAGMVQDAYFIDIGVPEDFERAQREIHR
jgi:D-glycero-alpha-D-manno-heptose 1-phosphate guanylyltransferase